MDGHDPNRVVVVLGEDRVGVAALAGEQADPGEVPAQAASSGVGPRARLVDHVADAAPDVTGVGGVECHVHRPSLVDEGREEVGRTDAARLPGQGAEVLQGPADGVIDEFRRRVVAGVHQIDHRPPARRHSYSSTSLQP